ncbi:FAD:protein FMN transferase, partial [Thalassolituus sp. UBA1505]
HRLASVTVIDASSAMADGWATALNVAGPEKGMALAEQYRMAVFMIVRTDDGFSELSSAEFRRRYLQQP